MDLLIVIVAVLGGVTLLIGARLLEGMFDKYRIKRYIEARGGKLIRARWSSFGPGWLGNRNQRFYRIVYRDADGKDHRATCKTSLFSGVYFTGDTVLKYRFVETPKFECISCGYNLTGNVSGYCPECGNPLHEDQGDL